MWTAHPWGHMCLCKIGLIEQSMKAGALLKPEAQGEACMQVGPADYEAECEKLIAASCEVPLEELVCFFGSEVLQFQR